VSEAWRLFVALHLPDEVISVLDAVQNDLRAAVFPGLVSWVVPRNIHLTLKFLGDIPLSEHRAIAEALTSVAAVNAPFELCTGRLGCFPSERNPRVVWVGVQGQTGALQRLRDAVEGAIAPLGYPTEDRPFSPHLTLGRVRRDAQRRAAQTLGRAIQASAAPPAVTWQVTEVNLFRSELKPDGAVYTLLHRASLK
jgi:2'-5' RNA ligase